MHIPTNLSPLLSQFPADIQEKIIAGWSQPRSIVSFRINRLLATHEEVVEALKSASLPYHVWQYWWDAFWLPKEHEYTLRWLEMYKQWKIYVQSLSSMIPALCLDLQPGQKILDMTAAPWGKTTQIASMLWGNCDITALEKFGIRFEKLSHTIRAQWAEAYVKCLKIDATETVSHFSGNAQANKGEKIFDRILIDAPCSSDGRICLTDEKTYKWYSDEKSTHKSLLQYELLEQARKMLKDGGKIVYSTCSTSRRENEDVIQKFLTKHPEFTLLTCLITPDYTLENKMNRWYPSETMEGFFVVVLEKK